MFISERCRRVARDTMVTSSSDAPAQVRMMLLLSFRKESSALGKQCQLIPDLVHPGYFAAGQVCQGDGQRLVTDLAEQRGVTPRTVIEVPKFRIPGVHHRFQVAPVEGNESSVQEPPLQVYSADHVLAILLAPGKAPPCAASPPRVRPLPSRHEFPLRAGAFPPARGPDMSRPGPAARRSLLAIRSSWACCYGSACRTAYRWNHQYRHRWLDQERLLVNHSVRDAAAVSLDQELAANDQAPLLAQFIILWSIISSCLSGRLRQFISQGY